MCIGLCVGWKLKTVFRIIDGLRTDQTKMTDPYSKPNTLGKLSSFPFQKDGDGIFNALMGY